MLDLKHFPNFQPNSPFGSSCHYISLSKNCIDSQILKWENARTRTKIWTRFHEDWIRRPDFRVPEGMVIVYLRACDIRDGPEWT
jgi:hypothetical protein